MPPPLDFAAPLASAVGGVLGWVVWVVAEGVALLWSLMIRHLRMMFASAGTLCEHHTRRQLRFRLSPLFTAPTTELSQPCGHFPAVPWLTCARNGPFRP